MKKALLTIAITTVLMCLFAISVSAESIIYKDTQGNVLFTAQSSDVNRVFAGYEGSFPNFDGEGNALTWYATATEESDGNKIITVDSFATIDLSGAHATLTEKGVYSYINRDKELSIVSAYFPDNANILTLSLSDTGYASKYVFSDEKQSSLLFLRVPNTLTELPSRIAQATQIIDFVAPDDAPYQSLSPTSFYDCQNLRSVDIPKNVTIIYSNGHSNNGHTFYRCTKLTDVYFAPDSQLVTIQNYAFSNCKALKEITIPNSVIELGSQVFWDCSSLETVRLGANQGKGLDTYSVQSMLYGCNSLKYVYISRTLAPTSGSHLFYSGASGMVFFYTGTYEEYVSLNDTLKALTNNGRFTGATPIEWNSTQNDQYYKDLAANDKKNYVVYGYNSCNAFYGGEHKLSSTEEMKLNSYFEAITFVSSCQNGCGKEITNNDKTISPIFTYRGYSMTEKPINGAYSVTQGYTVNREALDKYLLVNPDFKFGLVASGYSNPLGDDVDESKVVNRPGETFVFEHFEIKVNGISGENLSKNIVFCAYVIDNGTVYYLDNNKTSTEINGISFKDLYAVKFEKELEI